MKNNHVEVVRILINNRADVNATDECLFTPLLLAGSALNRDNPEGIAKFVEIIRILVSAEAKLDVTHPDTGIIVNRSSHTEKSVTPSSSFMSDRRFVIDTKYFRRCYICMRCFFLNYQRRTYHFREPEANILKIFCPFL